MMLYEYGFGEVKSHVRWYLVDHSLSATIVFGDVADLEWSTYSRRAYIHSEDPNSILHPLHSHLFYKLS